MRKPLVAALLAASALLLASCAMPADDPNFNSNGGEFGVDSSADPTTVSAAADSVTAALAPPTSIGVDAPLTAPPAKGLLIVSLTDGSDQNALLNASIEKAAKVIGWKFTEVPGADSAETAPAAFEKALALKPAGIRISGDYVDSLADGLAKAAAAKIPVVCTGCSEDPTGAITDTSIDGDAQNTEWGNLLSSYVFTNKAADEDAYVEMFTMPGQALATFNVAFEANMANLCRNCSTNENVIDTTALDQAATFVSDTMTTSLGRWALLDTGAISAGVNDALVSNVTLLSPVILVGRGAAAADIAAMAATPPVAAGAATAAPSASPAPSDSSSAADSAAAAPASDSPEYAASLQAWTALPVPVMGWRVVDQFARILGGDALATGPLPSQLLTIENSGSAVLDADGNYIGIADFEAQFTKLWGVS